MRAPSPQPLSRRSLLLLSLMAPAGLLIIAGIIGLLQYRQFRGMVAPEPAIAESVPTAADSARLAALEGLFRGFPEGRGPDTLSLALEDLTLLANASPAVARDGLRIRFAARESLLVMESSRPVDSLQGRVSGLFKRIAPVPDGWLNARVEGLPEWKKGSLALDPQRGYLNETRVPRTSLTKRGGLSPRDYLAPEHLPDYERLLGALDTVTYRDGKILLIRKGTR